MGTMFGDQNSLAAQLFAGAKPGAKPAEPQAAAATETDPSDAGEAQAQGLAGAFAILPAPLVDQTQIAVTTSAEAAPSTPAATAIDPNSGSGALEDPTAPAQTAVAEQRAANPQVPSAAATPAAPAPAPPTAAEAKAAPLPAVAADAAAAAATAVATGEAASATPGDPTTSAQTTAAATPVAAQAAARNAATTEKPAPADKSGAGVASAADSKPANAPVAPTATAHADGQGPADPDADSQGKLVEGPARETQAEHRDPVSPQQTSAATVIQANPATHNAAPLRATPETVAHLANQIAKHLEGRNSHFELQLTPAGLGHVGVRVEISAHGQLTAAMSFDNANAANELRGRAAELTRALEQAGFDVSGGISFDVAGDQGRSGQNAAQQQQDYDNSAWRGRAFQAALAGAGETAEAALTGALNIQRRSMSGVDVRI